MGKRTNEEYIELLKIANDKVIPLEDYNGSNKKILHKCLVCNNEWMVVPHSLLRGYGCPKCFRKRKIKVHDCFAKEVYDLVGDEYTLLTKYNKAHEKIKVKHNVCGTEYDVMPYKILNGRRCPTCFGNAKKTTDEFKSEVHSLVGDEYIVLGEYQGDSIKIEMIHNSCGRKFFTKPNTFLQGSRCALCSNCLKRDTDMFKKEVEQLVGDEFSVLGEYTNRNEKILMRHNVCNTEWGVIPYNFLHGTRCPTCMQSKGEKRVKDYLEFLKIEYVPQMKYDNLLGVNNGQLSYDFYVPSKNILIEYQGQYHDGTAYNQTEEGFIQQQEHDKRKKKYADGNNIKLLEIWYWDFDNIEDILNNNLSTK